MQVLVVYESLFGNTEKLAKAIGDAFAGHHVEVVAAGAVEAPALAAADVLVMGTPTHVHGLPSPRTREMAVKQGRAVPSAVAERGVREVLEELQQLPPVTGRLGAAFDTRISGPALFTGMPSRKVGRRLEGKGFRLLMPPESFFVEGDPAALMPGELERAQAWGRRLAAAVPAPEPVLAG